MQKVTQKRTLDDHFGDSRCQIQLPDVPVCAKHLAVALRAMC